MESLSLSLSFRWVHLSTLNCASVVLFVSLGLKLEILLRTGAVFHSCRFFEHLSFTIVLIATHFQLESVEIELEWKWSGSIYAAALQLHRFRISWDSKSKRTLDEFPKTRQLDRVRAMRIDGDIWNCNTQRLAVHLLIIGYLKLRRN